MDNQDPYFDIFKQPSDHNIWGKQIKYVSVKSNIDENRRIELLSALDFLQKELGKGFLKTSGNNHPLKQKIENKAEWQVSELIDFAGTLRALKASDSSYPNIVQKLLAFEKSRSEGIPFIEIASGYLSQKFQVRFPSETNFGKSPDIEILNPENNDTFFIEVSVVNESEDRNIISNNYHFLHHQFQYVQPVFFYTGQQKRRILPEEYPKFRDIIARAKKKVELTQKVVSFCDEKLEFFIAPFDKLEELDIICEKKGTRRNDVSGLNLNFDDTERIVSRIKKEAGQIPSHSNGIIYFPINPLFFMVTDLGNSIIRLQDYITKFTNILGVVLYSRILDSRSECFVEIEKHLFSRKMLGNVLCRELLFVCNYNCEVKLTVETLQKIYSTFK